MHIYSAGLPNATYTVGIQSAVKGHTLNNPEHNSVKDSLGRSAGTLRQHPPSWGGGFWTKTKQCVLDHEEIRQRLKVLCSSARDFVSDGWQLPFSYCLPAISASFLLHTHTHPPSSHSPLLELLFTSGAKDAPLFCFNDLSGQMGTSYFSGRDWWQTPSPSLNSLFAALKAIFSDGQCQLKQLKIATPPVAGYIYYTEGNSRCDDIVTPAGTTFSLSDSSGAMKEGNGGDGCFWKAAILWS